MDSSQEMIFAEERQARILKLLKKEHKVFVPALCELFGVSPATIRNDLNYMQDRGMLTRTHGGAILKQKTGFEENVEEKLSKNSKQKEKIAIAAAECVDDGDTIAIDTGTTTLAFARQLINKRNITVVTNDINIADFFDKNKEDVTVILLGGVLRKKHNCTLGAVTLACMDGLRVDKCFLAANGLTAEFGLSTPDMNHAEVKKKLAKMGEQTVLLCDSEKIGRDVFIKAVDVSEIDILITDSGADETELDRIEQAGVDIKVVPMEE